MTLKVCLLPYRPSASGAASYTIELTKALSYVGIEVILVGCELKRQTLIDGNVKLIDCGRDPVLLQYAGGPILDHVLLSAKLKKIFADLNGYIDVLHFTLASASVLFNNEFITTAWLPLSTIDMIKLHPKLLKFPKNILANIALLEYNIMEFKSFRKASKIICLTESAFKKMSKAYPTKAVLVPPPIEICKEPKKDYSSTKPSILFVSRDLSYPRKNLKTLLLALKLLVSKGVKNFKLILVGDNLGSLSPLVNSLRKAGIEVILYGRMPRKKLLKLYRQVDIFVSPNIYEEVGYVTLEAVGAGLPIIASDIPPFRDLVKNGVNGYLVPALDYESYAKKLIELIEDSQLRKKMSEASFYLAMQHFSYEVVGKKLKDIYRRHLDN
jgi:glycosyltransferase involved in cell wall biosynthesis